MPYKDKDKQREYQRQWIKSRRLEYLSDKCCAECGESNMLELHIHHKDPTQKVSHRIWSWSRVRRDEELLKCDVLCEPCHKKKHATTHGTERMYLAHKCRCDICKAGYSEIRRQRRSKQKQLPSVSFEGRAIGEGGGQAPKSLVGDSCLTMPLPLLYTGDGGNK